MIIRNLIALKAIASKEMVRVLRIWPQTLLPPIITASLYFVIFGSYIGRYVGLIEGVPYVLYITPGLIMMGAMMNAYTNVSSSFFGAKFQRNIDEMLVAPVPNYILLFGYLSGGILRGFLVAFAITLVSMLFTPLEIAHPFVTLLAIFLAMILFALAGFINGLFASKFDDVAIVPSFILTPLIYMGGVFYSINSLSNFWQNVSQFNPICYIINAFRYGMLSHSEVKIYYSLSMIAVFIVVLYSVAIYMLNKGTGLKS